MHTVGTLAMKFPAPEYSSRQSVQGTAVRMSSALPKARALGRSMEGSPVGAAVPCKPNTCWARTPTKGAARAASAPSKHLREGSPVSPECRLLQHCAGSSQVAEFVAAKGQPAAEPAHKVVLSGLRLHSSGPGAPEANPTRIAATVSTCHGSKHSHS